jgi:hypothetical protein
VHRDTSDPALLRAILKVRDGAGGDHWWVECGICECGWQVPHYAVAWMGVLQLFDADGAATPEPSRRSSALRSTLGHTGERAMAKPRKPNAARRPPVPSDSHADIEGWIRRVMPDLDPIVKRLDELICETIPGLRYAVKWKRAYYGLPELGWIIEMVAYDVSVNVVFFGGAELDPPPPLGTTDRSRYVKVKTFDEAEGPEMHKWVEQAGRVPGWQ